MDLVAIISPGSPQLQHIQGRYDLDRWLRAGNSALTFRLCTRQESEPTGWDLGPRLERTGGVPFLFGARRARKNSARRERLEMSLSKLELRKGAEGHGAFVFVRAHCRTRARKEPWCSCVRTNPHVHERSSCVCACAPTHIHIKEALVFAHVH